MNHLPNVEKIFKLDSFWLKIRQMQNLFPNDYNLFANTWIYPTDIIQDKKHKQ